MKILNKSLWPETAHGAWMKKEGKPGLVSVIIPTYNRSQYVLDAIESVWKQTYRSIELIVIDDGSTDDTKAVVEEWFGQHELSDGFIFRYFLQKNMGVSGARNHGLIVSEGEYIQFLDSDDLLLPERLSKCVSVMQDSDADLVHSAYYLDYSSESSEHVGRGVVITGPAKIGEKPKPANYIWTAAGLYRRVVILEAGPWNESLCISEDAEYFSRIFAVVEHALAIPDALVIKRKHGEQRLLDLQKKYLGLESKLRSLLLREKIVQSCGYDETEFVGAWLWIAQDALAAGIIDLGRQALAHSREILQSKKSLVRWYLLYFSSFLPRLIVMVFWQSATTIRNKLVWQRDMIRGKYQQTSKN